MGVVVGISIVVSIVLLFVRNGKYLGGIMGIGILGVIYSIFETIAVRRGGSFPTLSVEILGIGIGASIVGVGSSIGKPHFDFCLAMLLIPMMALGVYLFQMYKHSETL